VLAQQLSAPISEFFSHLLNVQSMLGQASRVVDMFNMRSSLTEGDIEPENFAREIELRNVSFEYEHDKPVLRGANLEIKRGEFVALVGPSGAGKSTLTDLILRLYDVGDGAILYDGTDIREFRQRMYRKRFGVVDQECLLFNATVRENIVFHRREEKALLDHAIWAANAEDFIDHLPNGLDTMVGDRGVRLSGGQRQRIAIARAIYGHPDILVLDEATSSLDSESERAVQAAINRIAKEVTAIVIAHRLSTVTHADKIVVLNDGEIEAVGTHADLLEHSPTYSRLYELQFQQQATAPEAAKV
jgi:subfamily B ATP-binding cassette protein MsbA